MFSKITFIALFATYAGMILYLIFGIKALTGGKGITGPIGVDGLIMLALPMLIMLIAGSVVIAKNTDVKPVLNIVVYIILSIGLVRATFYVESAIYRRNYAMNKAKDLAIYAELTEKGECLAGNRSYAIYYYDSKVYELHFSNEELSNLFVSSVDEWSRRIEENDYIRAYEVNEKYVLMLNKTALEDFDSWIMYVENVGYLYLGDQISFYAIIEYEKNTYKILDEGVHAKISGRFPGVFQSNDTTRIE